MSAMVRIATMVNGPFVQRPQEDGQLTLEAEVDRDGAVVERASTHRRCTAQLR